MHFRKIKPDENLNRFVRYFWMLKTDPDLSDSVTFRIVADGCPGMIFQNGASRLSFSEHKNSYLPPLFLYGQSTKFGNLYSSGNLQVTGVQFHPHALKPVFGFNADEMTDEVLDIDLIESGLADRLEQAKTIKDQAGILSSFILRQIERHSYIDLLVQETIACIDNSIGNVSFKDLHQSLQLSERQFERRFKRNTGITPVLFSRIARFQSALYQIRYGQYQKLSDVAFDNHYSDQSHFIREFKEFSGFKPGSYHVSVKEIIEICK